MYVIRSALRASTGRPPARFIRGRRYPSTPRLRTFHSTRYLEHAPNTPPPDSTSGSHNDASNTNDETAAADTEPQAGASTVANEDPEGLAQKLQRSRETSRRYSAALRRQQRGKRVQGLPPVVIPDWFLKSRVVVREDQPQHNSNASGPPLLSVAVTHKNSGEQATCSIPAGDDLDAPLVLSRLVRGLWHRRLDASEWRKLEEYLDKRTEAADEKTSPHIPAPEDQVVAEMYAILGGARTTSTKQGQTKPEFMPSTAEDAAVISAATKLSHLLHDPDMSSLARPAALTKHTARLIKASKRRAAAKARDSGHHKLLSPLVAAEIRATIAASLSSLRPAAGDSFPSIKTNVILHAPNGDQENAIDQCILSNARELGSDVITLQAQDLAQLGGDYLGEGVEPSPRSIRSLGYETYRLSSELKHATAQDSGEGAEDESESSQPSSMDPSTMDPSVASRTIIMPMTSFFPMMKSFMQDASSSQLGLGSHFGASSSAVHDEPVRAQHHSDTQLEDMKITHLLESLIDANESKQSRGLVGCGSPPPYDPPCQSDKPTKSPAFFDYSMSSEGTELELNSLLPANAKDSVDLVLTAGSTPGAREPPSRSKIIYVKDFKELNATHYGGRIIEKLEEVVRKRRSSGERIMIVGSTCSTDLTPELSARYDSSILPCPRLKLIHHSGVQGLQYEGESSPFRTIVTTAEPSGSIINSEILNALGLTVAATRVDTTSAVPLPSEVSKLQRINVLHIQDMLRSLDPVAAASISDMDKSLQNFGPWAHIFSASYFDKILTYDEVHRIALTALGLFVTEQVSAVASGDILNQVNWAHVALAIGLLEASDASKSSFFETLEDPKRSQRYKKSEDSANQAGADDSQNSDEAGLKRQRRLAQIEENATKHEKRLMPGIADPHQIKTTFDHVHVPKDTIDSLRTITSLSLLRPEAFSYGILATEKISGALLYGPPGTGKTLLAKAVAKESGSTVLEVSGSQIMDKYVGEGEKNVAAVFSLARKLSPCIVFLDEADAVFASRDAMRDRTSHRDILNQFLKEWDGLNDLSVFVMVATNRPFDLDDAVIRRLPRRLLVDLPTQADRKEILKIHLTGEQLHESIDLEDLAKRTPFYSGSDLKNVAVSAALACVKEENEQAAIAAAKATLSPTDSTPLSSSSPSTPDSTSTSIATPPPSPSSSNPSSPPHLVRGQTYIFPEKRTLQPHHFDKALQEISASISEDMSSLSAIKKFDEQFGDRKGNKRRKDFGFGVLAQRNESAARVRT